MEPATILAYTRGVICQIGLRHSSFQAQYCPPPCRPPSASSPPSSKCNNRGFSSHRAQDWYASCQRWFFIVDLSEINYVNNSYDFFYFNFVICEALHYLHCRRHKTVNVCLHQKSIENYSLHYCFSALKIVYLNICISKIIN